MTSTGAAGVAAALRRAGGLLRRRGLIVVVSDLYEDEAALVEIRRLARMGHDVVVIQIMARQELTLPRGGAIEFVDLETRCTPGDEPGWRGGRLRAQRRGVPPARAAGGRR